MPQTFVIMAFLLATGGCQNQQPMAASANVPTREAAHHPAREMALDLGDGVKMEFVWIDALECWVGKYVVTNREYRRFKPEHNSGAFEGYPLNGPRQPVVEVSCDDAVAFAEWVNRNAQLPAGCNCRLPDGKEWLTFARCGDGRTYPWGNEMPPRYGNYHGQEGAGSLDKIGKYNDGYPVTCPVEKSGKNEWGLYGVGGNVWQWTSEWYDNTHECRVLRGAAWDSSDSGYLECAASQPQRSVTSSQYFRFSCVIGALRTLSAGCFTKELAANRSVQHRVDGMPGGLRGHSRH